MRGVIVTVTVGVIAALLVGAQAQAAREACLARTTLGAVGMSTEHVYGPARLFAFQLSAQSDRTVSGSLVLDTDRGWFVAPFSAVPIASSVQHYTSTYGNFVKHVWQSPVLYVDVGHAVTVNHYFLDHVTAVGDTAPPVRCYDPYYQLPVPAPTVAPGDRVEVPMQTDPINLTAPPPAGTPILQAKTSAPLASASCAEPFRNATMLTVVFPAYPRIANDMGRPVGAADIDVFIDSTGRVQDAWIDMRSGLMEFDNDALRAAMASTYRPAVAYCTPIPSTYEFNASWNDAG